MSHAATDTANYQLESARWSKGRNALLLFKLSMVLEQLVIHLASEPKVTTSEWQQDELPV